MISSAGLAARVRPNSTEPEAITTSAADSRPSATTAMEWPESSGRNLDHGQCARDQHSRGGYALADLHFVSIPAGTGGRRPLCPGGVDLFAIHSSPGHRANILNCDLRELGVGYYVQLDDQSNVRLDDGQLGGPYRYYWTQDFGSHDAELGGNQRRAGHKLSASRDHGLLAGQASGVASRPD